MISRSKVSFFLIVFVALICCSAVSATDANNSVEDIVLSTDTGITTQDADMVEDMEVVDESQKNIESTSNGMAEKTDKTIQKKTTDTNTKKAGTYEVNNYDGLKTAVNSVNTQNIDTIQLQEGIYVNTGTIEWNTREVVLTIDGNGQTIDGRGQRVFKVSSGATLILKNITITNTTGEDDGGAIYNNGNLTVTDSTFHNNAANIGGGAIYNYFGNLTVTGSTFHNNTAKFGGAILHDNGAFTVTGSTFHNNAANSGGGAIYNDRGYFTVTGSTFHNNTANGEGGAIYDSSTNIWSNISSSNFTYNTANSGAAIRAAGWTNLTGNTFKENRANSNKETIYLYGFWNGLFDGNVYEFTDVNLNEKSLSIKGGESTHSNDVDVVLNFTIRPTNRNYYFDFQEGISDITIYVNGEKNVTTGYENYTLTGLKPGEYEVYFTSCNQQSNTVTFVVKNSQITTPETIYEYYAGINDKIPFTITDGGEKGTITLTVKEGDEYKKLSTAYNVGEQYSLSTEALAELLENVYDELDSSYIINATYETDDDFVSPSSTEFTLNIIKQRNTSIVYDIINDTEGSVEINITVMDAVYKSPIDNVQLIITGDVTGTVTSGIVYKNTELTEGETVFNVKFEETEDYKESELDITLTVQKDLQKIIDELNESLINNQTALAGNITALLEANEQITQLEQEVATIREQLESNKTALAQANAQIVILDGRISELEDALAANITALTQLEEDNEALSAKIEELEAALAANKTALAQANAQIETLNDQIDDLETQLEQKEAVLEETQTALEIANNQTRELEEQIAQLTKAKETTIIIDPLENIKYGDEITITGLLINEDSISLSNLEVTIVFNDEETTVTTRNGEFKYTTTATLIGENTITATFTGSDKYQESEATYTFEVAKADTVITIDDIEAVKKGESVTIKGTLTDHNGNTLANKVVRLLINNGRKTLKTDADGAYSFDYALTKVGENTITATFEGDDYCTESTETITVEALALSTQITIDPVDTIVKGTKATFTGTLMDENGEAIANAQVKLNINGNTKTLKTDSEGRFTHTFTMNTVGENTITATYAGSASYEAAEAEITVEVVKAEAVITLDPIESVTKGDNATFTGKLTDANGKAIANAQVKITINGSPKTLRTDENGVFTHSFKMIKEGTNNITVVFNGNNYYLAAEASSTVEVVKAE